MSGARDGGGESSEELARRAQRGSREAFDRLVERHAEPLYNFARALSRDAAEAEDVAQEAFVRAWQALERYDPNRRFATWLFAIARRVAIGALRARRPGPLGEGGLERAGAEPDPAGAAGEREERERVWSVARRVLGPEQRAALWLRYAEDASAREIGRVLGRRATTVRVILFRARAALGEHLRADERRAERAGARGARLIVPLPGGKP